MIQNKVFRNSSNPFTSMSTAVLLGCSLVLTMAFFGATREGTANSKEPQSIVLELFRLHDNKNGVRVTGFSPEQFEALRTLENKATEFSKCFQLHVVPSDAIKSDEQESMPAVLGKSSLVVNPPALLFEPRFSLQDGIRYRARLQWNGLNIQAELYRALEPKLPTTFVEQVYPTGTKLPENLLKFYIHFSNPMAMRNVYQHVHLRDEGGQELVQPFLEIHEELWDPQGKRLTLLLDPGRIKRGLVPNVENGSILRKGGRYTLVMDAALQDALGQPLVRSFQKEFIAIDSDHRQPQLDEWKIELPKVGSRDPWIIRFGESLEQAIATRGMQLYCNGSEWEGQFSLREQESESVFLPAKAWGTGEYELRVNSAIEDLAGNSLRKPFEIEMTDGERRLQDGYLSRRFHLK
jgi:hypothetical protein